MHKPHIAREYAPNLQTPERKGAWVWGVWESKEDRDNGKPSINWSLHCAFIKVAVRDLNNLKEQLCSQ